MPTERVSPSSHVDGRKNASGKSCDVVDYDHVITHLIVQHQRNKQLKLWCKTQTVFRCTDTPNHSWIKLNIQYTKEMDALLAKKYPNLVEIANHRFA